MLGRMANVSGGGMGTASRPFLLPSSNILGYGYRGDLGPRNFLHAFYWARHPNMDTILDDNVRLKDETEMAMVTRQSRRCVGRRAGEFLLPQDLRVRHRAAHDIMEGEGIPNQGFEYPRNILKGQRL